jgi:hypothetical protein
VTFDAFLSATAEIFVIALSPVERQAFYRALTILLQDPYPDGASKFRLEFFPYRPGTMAFTHGDFSIIYTIASSAYIYIASVYWRPDSPRRLGELLEI